MCGLYKYTLLRYSLPFYIHFKSKQQSTTFLMNIHDPEGTTHSMHLGAKSV